MPRGMIAVAVWRRPTGVVGVVVVAIAIFTALFAPRIAPHDPQRQNLNRRLQLPSSEHWLGTDNFGRDIASRIIWGGRVSLVVAASAIAIGAVGGSVMGIVGGFFGGRSDASLTAITDILMAFPALLLAVAVVAMLGRGLGNLALAIGIANTPQFARLMRGETLRTKSLDFVDAARALGASHGRILLMHLLPNISSVLIVITSLRISAAILAESSLSFLGLGIPPPTPSWGTMIAEGQPFLLTAPWVSSVPGIAIAVLVMALNLLGDTVRDALDPRLRTDER